MIYRLLRDWADDLLNQLTCTGEKPSVQQFDELRSTPATRYVCDLLVVDEVLPLRDEYLSPLLRRHGFAGLASRNSARLALASYLPASVLVDRVLISQRDHKRR
ncbi:hypothetical protein PUR34_11605 [Streptomyces sp. JV185]|uniref:hypothetical protein n=1 Tax=Streptomyces sp. JV185 TaxID=858638 RepID=UPI002E77D212|nr:hypothetical protein [Streptomyces sp. JV185]MEE1768788.1 hypothetical protein [Streptomyces sp. JV185]